MMTHVYNLSTGEIVAALWVCKYTGLYDKTCLKKKQKDTKPLTMGCFPQSARHNAFNSSFREAEYSLVYIASSRSTEAIWCDTMSQKTKPEYQTTAGVQVVLFYMPYLGITV